MRMLQPSAEPLNGRLRLTADAHCCQARAGVEHSLGGRNHVPARLGVNYSHMWSRVCAGCGYSVPANFDPKHTAAAAYRVGETFTPSRHGHKPPQAQCSQVFAGFPLALACSRRANRSSANARATVSKAPRARSSRMLIRIRFRIPVFRLCAPA